MNQEAENLNRSWTRDEVEKTLTEILVDALDLDEGRVVPSASLVHDLGAESIDFLDIGFRIQQTFGVELPNKAIQDRAVNWRNLSGLREILEERYGIKISPEETRQFLTMGLPGVLGCLKDKHGISVNDGDAEKLAAEMADKLVSEVEVIGFRAALIDHDGVKNLFLENLNSPKIIEGMLRLFSVGSVTDFITERVNAK